jgi:3-oxoacyl-[acyl-carrier-protein] synthase II
LTDLASPAPEPIAVVGAGVKAPGGLDVDELWASLCEARSTAVAYVDERLPADARVLVSRVTGFDPDAYLSPVERRRIDRAHHLAIAAAQDAIDACGEPLPPRERCAVVCGTGFGASAFQEEQYEQLVNVGFRGVSPHAVPTLMPSAMASLLSLRFGFKGPCVTLSAACASGATAIAEGVELLRRGAADLVLAGGGDSLVTRSALSAFLRLDVMSRNVDCPALASRPFDVDRDGFVMGEGAGFVVLQRARDALASRRVLGLVAGHASTADAHHIVAPHPAGEGALRCMRLALADARVKAAELSHVNAHGTSTVPGDLAEAAAVRVLLGDARLPLTAVKGTTGHLIGGSGAVEAIVTLRSLEARLVPPVAGLRRVDPRIDLDAVSGAPRKIDDGPALSSSFGFGGMNTCLVLRAAGNGRAE